MNPTNQSTGPNGLSWKQIATTVTIIFGLIAGSTASWNTLSGWAVGRLDQRMLEHSKVQFQDPDSFFRMKLETMVEAQAAELFDAIVSDDLEYIERQLAELQHRVEKLEGDAR